MSNLIDDDPFQLNFITTAINLSYFYVCTYNKSEQFIIFIPPILHERFFSHLMDVQCPPNIVFCRTSDLISGWRVGVRQSAVGVVQGPDYRRSRSTSSSSCSSRRSTRSQLPAWLPSSSSQYSTTRYRQANQVNPDILHYYMS